MKIIFLLTFTTLVTSQVINNTSNFHYKNFEATHEQLQEVTDQILKDNLNLLGYQVSDISDVHISHYGGGTSIAFTASFTNGQSNKEYQIIFGKYPWEDIYTLIEATEIGVDKLNGDDFEKTQSTFNDISIDQIPKTYPTGKKPDSSKLTKSNVLGNKDHKYQKVSTNSLSSSLTSLGQQFVTSETSQNVGNISEATQLEASLIKIEVFVTFKKDKIDDRKEQTYGCQLLYFSGNDELTEYNIVTGLTTRRVFEPYNGRTSSKGDKYDIIGPTLVAINPNLVEGVINSIYEHEGDSLKDYVVFDVEGASYEPAVGTVYHLTYPIDSSIKTATAVIYEEEAPKSYYMPIKATIS